MHLSSNLFTRRPGGPEIKTVEDCIRAEWSLLSEEEIAAAENDHLRFCTAVEEKYGLTREEIEIQYSMWERECKKAH